MTTLTRIPVTPGQKKQITRVGQDAVEQAIEEFDLDKDGGQAVHGRGDEFSAAIKEAVRQALADLSTSDKYKDEEVSSNYGYLSGYNPNPSLEQNFVDMVAELGVLRKAFPQLANSDLDREYLAKIQSGEIVLPKGSERWVLIPRWKLLDETYSGAVAKLIAAVKSARDGRLHNYRDGQIDERHLRQTARSAAAWERIGAEQKGDILIVPIQAGILHRGKSVRRAREVFAGDEFGLGAFAVGIVVLTHRERLDNVDDLWMDCAGDEWSPAAGGVFSKCPCWRFDGGKVEFVTSVVGLSNGYYGSVSGRVPQ